MVVFNARAVDSLTPLVRPGQILILIDFHHSLEALAPLAAQGCHTIVLMPLAPNRYAFLADQEISTVVMELLTTELASLCEHVPSERHQEFVAGFVLSQLAGEVYQLGAMLQDPSGNSASSMLGPNSELTEPTGPVRQDTSPSRRIRKSILSPILLPTPVLLRNPGNRKKPHSRCCLSSFATNRFSPGVPRRCPLTTHVPCFTPCSTMVCLNTTPPDLVAWAKNQQEQHGGL